MNGYEARGECKRTGQKARDRDGDIAKWESGVFIYDMDMPEPPIVAPSLLAKEGWELICERSRQMNGYEAAVECMGTGQRARIGTMTGDIGVWHKGEFCWHQTLGLISAHSLGRSDWLLEPIKPPEPEQPDCPEGFELWPLHVGNRAELWGERCDDYGRDTSVLTPNGPWDPYSLSTHWPDRFCGWRFENPRHPTRVSYRTDSWQVYDRLTHLTSAADKPEVPIRATHALMRKEAE